VERWQNKHAEIHAAYVEDDQLLTVRNDEIRNLTNWVDIFQYCTVELVAGTEVKDRALLKQLIAKRLGDIAHEFPPNVSGLF